MPGVTKRCNRHEGHRCSCIFRQTRSRQVKGQSMASWCARQGNMRHVLSRLLPPCSCVTARNQKQTRDLFDRFQIKEFEGDVQRINFQLIFTLTQIGVKIWINFHTSTVQRINFQLIFTLTQIGVKIWIDFHTPTDQFSINFHPHADRGENLN